MSDLYPSPDNLISKLTAPKAPGRALLESSIGDKTLVKLSVPTDAGHGQNPSPSGMITRAGVKHG